MTLPDHHAITALNFIEYSLNTLEPLSQFNQNFTVLIDYENVMTKV
jgi:hypothetical protein